MTIIQFFSHKQYPPQILVDENDRKPVQGKKRSFLIFILVFLCPLLTVVVLTLANGFALDNSLLKWYELDRFLGSWEESFGPFVRKYYLDGAYKRVYDGDKSRKHSTYKTFPPHMVEKYKKLPNPPTPSPDQCEKISDNLKFDCFPRGVPTEKECIARGCCFGNGSIPEVPVCFYPKMYRSYKYTNITKSNRGITALLTAQFKSPYPNDCTNLKIEFIFVTDEILFINISDADKARFKFPFPDDPIQEFVPTNPMYDVKINQNTTGFKVLRKSNKQVIFDSEDVGGFIYADQFMQISSILPSKNMYGLGERRNNFLLDMNWKTLSLFTHDSVPLDNVNGYGYFPFYLNIEEGGLSNSVLVWNLHPMDVVLQPGPAITYRIIGGYLGFLINLGPSPIEALQQYTSMVGRPMLPPYWSLGFHLSRFGYNTLNDLIKVWDRTKKAGIPFDTQWSDLDYMENRNDFTVDEVRYKGLSKFVNDLHNAGMHYVVIIDPGISGSETPGTYPPYDQGIKENIFVMDHTGKKPFEGKVWNPKSTVFPDFSHPKVVLYWLNQLKNLHDKIKFDGAWIDMNEPSNFLDGSTKGCPNNNLENPPYLPAVAGGMLRYKTLCMSSIHHMGNHYDLHNVYGGLEAVVTSFALSQLRGVRPFVISRSTSPGVGRYSGHWTGDVRSTWDDMKHSVADIMSFSMFGIPMVGADICGFNGNTTAPLCLRWSQLGAFYPFSRNHNSDDAIDQDPVSLGKEVTEAAKKAIMTRYALLPYLYTLFWDAHNSGIPVIQSMFMQFPKDANTYNISTQFMWGKALLIAPVLDEGLTYVKVYLGKGVWYNKYTSERIESEGKYYAISAPLDVIPLFHRGGTIIPLQQIGTTTQESRKKTFHIMVALNETKQAEGHLYWDDGETIAGQSFNIIDWTASENQIRSKIRIWRYDVKMPLSSIFVYSLSSVSKVQMDLKDVPFHYNGTSKILHVDFTAKPISLRKEFVVTWS